MTRSIEKAIQEAEQAIPNEYQINRGTGKPDITLEKAQELLWPQVGKLNTLRGHLVFDEFVALRGDEEQRSTPTRRKSLSTEAKKALQKATEYYTLALAYSTLLSVDYRDLRRAEDTIYDRFKRLNAVELGIVAETVKQVEQDYNLGKSAMLEFLVDRTMWFGD